MRADSLRPGAVFWIGPDRYTLIYVNRCRAYVKAHGRAVVVAGHRFSGYDYWNISPGTMVEI